MQKTYIYQVSEGSTYPLIFTRDQNSHMENIALDFQAVRSLELDPAHLHIFLIHCAVGQIEQVMVILKQAKNVHKYPCLMVLAADDYLNNRVRLALLPRTYVIDDAIRPGHLHLLIELLVGLENYRFMLESLSHESRERSQAFENLMELARTEKQSLVEESGAYQALTEFQIKLRASEEETARAMEAAVCLKNRELLALREQLEMVERLSEFRDRELSSAQRNFKAAEIALDMSHQENLERENIISALDRLRKFSDSELLELYNENLDLRRKLRIPESN